MFTLFTLFTSLSQLNHFKTPFFGHIFLQFTYKKILSNLANYILLYEKQQLKLSKTFISIDRE